MTTCDISGQDDQTGITVSGTSHWPGPSPITKATEVMNQRLPMATSIGEVF